MRDLQGPGGEQADPREGPRQRSQRQHTHRQPPCPDVWEMRRSGSCQGGFRGDRCQEQLLVDDDDHGLHPERANARGAEFLPSDGHRQDIVVATGLIGMYSRCGSVDRAREVFDRMSYRDTVAWTAMIAAYAHTGHPRQAMELFKAMDVAPNAFTVSCVLGACSDLGAAEEGRLFYKRVVSEGLEATTPVLNSLLDMLSKCGRLDEAREVFNSMGVRRDVISWSSMVAALVRHESFKEALEFYRRMDLEGVRPDLFVFASVLDACSRLGDLEQGKAVHERLRAGGSELDVVVSSALVNMYAKCKSLKDAKQVFDRISNKDVVAWTTMIVAFSQDGHSSEALELYEQMIARVEKPDAYVYASVLRACSSVGSLAKGREIHARILSEKMELDFVIKNSLLNMYLKCANLEEVRRMFDLTPQKDTILVTMMISAYAQGGHPEKALDLYHEMETWDVRPDGFTYASVINACTGMGALADGMVVHREIVRDGFDGDPVVQNSLVDMYSKCGSLGEARAVFDDMVKRDVATWTALFSGYAKHGFNNEALETFWCMALESMALDEIIFTTVLQACSHLGLVDEGRDYFVSMRRDFGLAPGVEHYVGMVDVLGRAGRLKEAEELLGGMPYEPTPVAWTTILGACKIHSDTERAKRMKADTEEEEETACMLMSNIYAASASKNELSRNKSSLFVFS
ncbi:pentatricopeptide repeat-containing protein At5g16860 [Selaginella moellendorffii]|uniref:pentatricopeptide repeat-containing protein At5g16860 n=1 Tax=Selaginella moellendorffii TaxID=88036 RepID=UPI000D1C55D8|nr:pentatricopeptide repeat-containing protein At5g16860 [Selaginella moellendorffii]|eukprot:XP_024537288.1 pentatricopeptide repeat-containing protein At5g16860 [Selaginella moellendorffii]